MGFHDKTDSEEMFSAGDRETSEAFEFRGGVKILQNFSNFGDHRFLAPLTRGSFIFNSISLLLTGP